MDQMLGLPDQIRMAVELGESHFREFKSALQGRPDNKKPRPTKEICRDIGEALVAFANADGGEILIGVEDSGVITGVDHLDANEVDKLLNAHISHVLSDTPISIVAKSAVAVEGKKVLIFRTSKSLEFVHLTSDGRCVRRSDLETVPASAEAIQLDRKEKVSREYDRQYVDQASMSDLDTTLLELVAEQISPGTSPEKILQYLGLGEFEPQSMTMRLRRAALLLFSKTPDRWHPRLQVRFMKVDGTKLGAGSSYNVSEDNSVSRNILEMIEVAWDQLRPFLAKTQLSEDGRFQNKFIYPENACREALLNAIAHRDYSDEGAGIEIYAFDDRIEIKNPGQLSSSISMEDLHEGKGAHDSRNSYIARTLREIGYMRELGEGMRRIFELMKDNELAAPELASQANRFSITLHHKPMYSDEEIAWLSQYENFELSSEQKAIILLGRNNKLIAPENVWQRLGIVDTEHYRKLIESLQTPGILYTEVPKHKAQKAARQSNKTVREIPRFKIRRASEIKPANLRHRQAKDPASTKLWVGNISAEASENNIKEMLNTVGSIDSLYVPIRDEGNAGYVFVEFVDAELSAALLKGEKEIYENGRKLVFRRAIPKKRVRREA